MRPLLWAVCTVLTILPACQWRQDCQDEEGVARMNADPSFPDEEQDAIQNAAQRWNVFAGQEVISVQARTYDVWVCTIINSSKNDVHNGAQGVTRSLSGNIEIALTFNCNGEPRGRGVPCFEAIVLHEMGHLLGLDHLPDGVDGIMRGTGGASLDFTEADRRACEAIGVCR